MSKDVKGSVTTWTAGNMAGLTFLESVTYTRIDFNSESFPQLRGILNSATAPLTFATHFPIIPFLRRNPLTYINSWPRATSGSLVQGTFAASTSEMLESRHFRSRFFMSDWQDQYRRLLRGFVRIQDASKQKEEYEDDLIHFFMDCWHLKDWIKNDGSISNSVRTNIVTQADGSDILTLCADLANRSKHLKLDRHNRKDTRLWGGIEVRAGDPTSDTLSRVRIGYVITANDGTRLGALDAAQQAVNEWRRIFTENGLAPE